jgi:UDP-N-acetylmuramate dehydrogenase
LSWEQEKAMSLQENYSLKNLNTFRLDVKAKYFAEVISVNDLVDVINIPQLSHLPIFVLGQGANVLFTKNFDGLIIKNSIKGVKIIAEDIKSIVIEAGAGENWDQFVRYCIDQNWGGIENMIYIPGTVGAAPVQNIAAYGQNFSDVFMRLSAMEIATKQIKTFTKEECEFEYRDSRFKTRECGKYIVVSVQIKLSKNPEVNTSYFETGQTIGKSMSLSGELANIDSPTIKDVANAVENIRKQKLPDVSQVGTAGSFFKNPVVARAKYEELKRADPDLQCYPVEGLNYTHDNHDDLVKIPAGRLLDRLGWKGKRIGNVGTYPTQALAVVNYGASADEILAFTKQMQAVVKNNYGIDLAPEVQII